MNQDLLANLSPYLLLSPYPPCIGFPSLPLAFLAPLRLFPFVSVIKERSPTPK